MYSSFCPLWSHTTKQASNSSTVQGGGKRRAVIFRFRRCLALNKSILPLNKSIAQTSWIIGRERHANPVALLSDRQDTPGQFDFYVLSLSWSPSFCAAAAEQVLAWHSRLARWLCQRIGSNTRLRYCGLRMPIREDSRALIAPPTKCLRASKFARGRPLMKSIVSNLTDSGAPPLALSEGAPTCKSRRSMSAYRSEAGVTQTSRDDRT
jgi:hypothetical protein